MTKLRRWYWKHIRGEEGEICHDCGRPVRIVWTAPDWMWAEAMGHAGGILCPPCFDVRMGHPNALFIRWTPEAEV